MRFPLRSMSHSTVDSLMACSIRAARASPSVPSASSTSISLGVLVTPMRTSTGHALLKLG